MEEQLETAQHCISAAADQFADMRGTEKAVLVDVAENLQIAFGQMDGRGVIASLKTWAARHPLIVSRHRNQRCG